MMESSTGETLAKQLLFTQKHIADLQPDAVEKSQQFCEDYKQFLSNAKTEREAVKQAIARLEAAGYRPFERLAKQPYRPGDKIYYNNRGKALIAATIGAKPLDEGVRLMIAHIDCPRIDLKPNPLFEEQQLALLKTHYYGGIRKYQWGVTPLSLHGIVFKANGESVEIHLGEHEDDPVFCITDLLPHLAGEHSKRSLADGLKGEELDIVIGSLPFEDSDAKERVKLQIMKLLHDQYGITERDFVRAEIEVVPAGRARDVGLDRSLVGGYGHDDRVCAYTALRAEIDTQAPAFTSVCVLADKEEIGSGGSTGLGGEFVVHFLSYLADIQGANYKMLLQSSKCLSADVSVAVDPKFQEVTEKHNSAHLNHGVCITKYTGVRGKVGTNDADAEMMAFVTRILDDAGVIWQTGELGRVDQGGGGTVAAYVSKHEIDTVDIGVPVLSMHSPFELVAKLDVYMTYRAFAAFKASDRTF